MQQPDPWQVILFPERFSDRGRRLGYGVPPRIQSPTCPDTYPYHCGPHATRSTSCTRATTRPWRPVGCCQPIGRA